MPSLLKDLPSFVLCLWILQVQLCFAQSVSPYSHAITDRLVHAKTPMAAPLVNTVFNDPDFGSRMVRVSDQSTNPLVKNGYLRAEGSGHTVEWNSKTTKFYVSAEGGAPIAFGFNPSTMKVQTLRGAKPGQGLILPLRLGPSFSFVDRDLIYGTLSNKPLVVGSYRFSTGATNAIVDISNCGTRPGIATGATSDTVLTVSAGDSRLAVAAGGLQFGQHMFVVVYDRQLGCRWYNTQTGQIGGRWGPIGKASYGGYLVTHVQLSKDGKYVHIGTNTNGKYFWKINSLTVSNCALHSQLLCGGYSTVGTSHLINTLGAIDEMNVGLRPIGNLSQISPLVWPLPTSGRFGLQFHFSWINADPGDSVPVCTSTYLYKEDYSVMTRPYEDEVFCIRTDLAASVIWRFAHTRASVELKYFNTQPVGSISQDGRFFLFTSNWDDQAGTEANGTPRSDVWIVELK